MATNPKAPHRRQGLERSGDAVWPEEERRVWLGVSRDEDPVLSHSSNCVQPRVRRQSVMQPHFNQVELSRP